MSFYIGVDGGGTKTAFSLFDEDKNVVKTVYGPGSNHENLEGAFDAVSYTHLTLPTTYTV